MFAEPEVYNENDSAREKARKMSREIIKERNDTTGGPKRSVKREHIVIKWILRVTHMNKDMSIDLAEWLQDGKVLSNVMTTLCFNSVENDPFINKGLSDAEHRVQQVITQIENYGVDPKYIFKRDDILLKKNTPKVIRCLEEVSKLAKKETHVKLDTLLKNKLYT
ncbi:hypothetical protein TCAL_12675 [Tigriopus californicus]|uniref:Calponin-homology (CH) domain-containing protein n=2 Tax=Tigriopus californicus TaxID=6832 RepID=A0A553PTW6_TIGCA|nr:hypothetical protein TCAL_12675 [Tigriopus californicus]